MTAATAVAHPNIAFIKYWGNRDDALRLPASGSISMNLGSLQTRTSVAFEAGRDKDEIIISGKPAEGTAYQRVTDFLDAIRKLAGISKFARVESVSDFPAGAGIASSASAFAALALAGSGAAGLDLSEMELSRLARLGSGSACRSVPGGFVEWLPGQADADSYAITIAPPDYWDLLDCIAVISSEPKKTGSSEGHRLARTSPLQAGRIATSACRLEECRRAILHKDFNALAEIAEMDSGLMHAVMSTSTPPLIYYEPATMTVMKAVVQWRGEGLPVFHTIDAGANVHVITTSHQHDEVCRRLGQIPGVKDVLVSGTGGPARWIEGWAEEISTQKGYN